MKYPRYPVYKDSGIEWIGEIPEHWETRRLKFVSKIQFSNVDKHSFDEEIPVKLANYTDVYKNQFITNEMEFMDATASQNEVEKFHLEAGDVLVTKDSETPDDIAIPALVKSTLPNLLCGYHLAILKPDNHNLCGDYLFHLYSDKKFRGKYESETNGITRFGLSQQSFNDTCICIPEITEQFAISSFLEKQVSKIDSLISKQYNLIGILKEKRQAIITRAVTKGLDPNVPMKDSGIEWIGKIPKHWDIKRLKYAAQLVTEKSRRYAKQVALENVESWSGRYIKTETEFEGEGVEFKDSDVLFGKLRPYLAKVYKAEFSGSAVGEFFVLRPNSDIESDFLSALLLNREFINLVDGSTYGAKMPRVDWGFMGNLLLAIPPTTEQRNIFKIIDAKTSKIDYLISKQEKMIELLKEHKTSLISNAVTGKIDVRGLIQEVKEPAGQTS